jgi:hypothetical protein
VINKRTAEYHGKKHPFLYCKKKKKKKKEEEYKRSLSLGVQGRDFTDR